MIEMKFRLDGNTYCEDIESLARPHPIGNINSYNVYVDENVRGPWDKEDRVATIQVSDSGEVGWMDFEGKPDVPRRPYYFGYLNLEEMMGDITKEVPQHLLRLNVATNNVDNVRQLASSATQERLSEALLDAVEARNIEMVKALLPHSTENGYMKELERRCRCYGSFEDMFKEEEERSPWQERINMVAGKEMHQFIQAYQERQSLERSMPQVSPPQHGQAITPSRARRL